MQYRITYRHEVIINAENDTEARQKWEDLELGQLDSEGDVVSNEFIEEISFEDEDYKDIRASLR
tara:strand:- start:115 stop:306 length:192 start_codon:yes stop_codon:yes gene_type:complete